MNSARSEAVLIHCQDPRFRPHVEQLVAAELGVSLDLIDVITVPGASWALSRDGEPDQLVMSGLQIAIDQHGARRLVIVHHRDCGAYGGSCAFANFEAEARKHENDILRAAHRAVARFSNLHEIHGFLADMKNNGVELLRTMPLNRTLASV